MSDSEKASELISTFEEKHPLARLMNDEEADRDDHGIQVYIGQETPVPTMKDCSVVTASYDLGEGMYGRIGIVGPKRMDYDKVVGILKNLTQQLDEIFKKEYQNRKSSRRHMAEYSREEYGRRELSYRRKVDAEKWQK